MVALAVFVLALVVAVLAAFVSRLWDDHGRLMRYVDAHIECTRSRLRVLETPPGDDDVCDLDAIVADALRRAADALDPPAEPAPAPPPCRVPSLRTDEAPLSFTVSE